jgi:hypothetical protein
LFDPRGRRAIGRSVLVGLVIVVVAAAGLAGLYATGGLGSSSSSTTSTSSTATAPTVLPTYSPSTSRTSTSSSTSGGTKGPSLAIDNMYGNVVGPGLGNLSSNTTTIDGDTLYVGNASETLIVQFDIVYTNCTASSLCPTHVIAVNIQTPGFTIVSTKPAFPIPTNPSPGAPSSQVEFHFTVNVKAPATQYNGPLLMIATAQ